VDRAVVDHGIARHAAVAGIERAGWNRAREHPADPGLDVAHPAGGIVGTACEHLVDRWRRARDLGEVVGGAAVVVGLPGQQRRQLAARIVDDHEPHEMGVGQLARPKHWVAIEIGCDLGQPLLEHGAAGASAGLGRELGEHGQRLGGVEHG
jgi:hypothetical protein